jgi:DNA (cytosine-5)-methyltransferase 1
MLVASSRMSSSLTAVSLFSGCGGMDVGFEQAGYEVLGCSELDVNAAATLRLNSMIGGKRARVFEGDVKKIDPQHLRIELGLEQGELGVLFGGPPCQSFSQAGKRGSLSDPRGALVFEMERFAREFLPRAVVIEQVRGFLSARVSDESSLLVLDQVRSGLERLGYGVTYRLLNAASYGVPQLRHRVILVAIKDGGIFKFPPPTHVDDLGCDMFGAAPFRNVDDALSGLGSPPVMAQATTREIEFSHVDVTPERDKERIKFVPEGLFLASQRHLDSSLLGSLTEKDTTKFLRVSRTRPANTLRGGELFFHHTEDRYLTPREYLRIHGYPDTFRLTGPIRRRTPVASSLCQHKQVANSVPPPLAYALAQGLKPHLTC